MKTRIALSILLIVVVGWVSHAVYSPASTIARNTAAVATVNGGDAAYVAQNVVETTNRLPFAGAFVLGGLIFIWAGPIRKLAVKIENNS